MLKEIWSLIVLIWDLPGVILFHRSEANRSNLSKQNDFRKDFHGIWGGNLREPITSQKESENSRKIWWFNNQLLEWTSCIQHIMLLWISNVNYDFDTPTRFYDWPDVLAWNQYTNCNYLFHFDGIYGSRFHSSLWTKFFGYNSILFEVLPGYFFDMDHLFFY